MSLFTSGLLPPGLIRPATEGGGTDYYNEKKTKISVITNPAVNPSYGIYKTYSNAPPTPNERDGNTATVVQQPRTVELSISDVFNPGNAEMEALTQYFSRVVPSKVKSTRAAITIGRFGVKQLLEQFLRSKLQEDMEVVEARMAGATDVERELAMARMQDRYSDMIRNYGTDQRVRQALLRQFIGRIDDPALRQALTRDIRHAEATLGTSTMSLNPGVVSTEGEAMAELDRSAYYDEVGSEMGENEIDYAGAGEEGETLIQPGEDEMVDEQPLLQPEESLIP
ncbi:hypothetical protein EBT16_13540, partial [bacterium]|nr:hypothetical protein [bacterium]